MKLRYLLAAAAFLALSGPALGQSLVTTPPAGSTIDLNTTSPLNVAISADDLATWVGSSGELSSLTVTATSASTDGGTSVQPVVMNSTMTGIGGVGGRAYFGLTTNVALGAWSNALKGEVVYGAAGRTTGLGSSILAEMQLSAGTSAGSYAPLEIELGLGTGALTGTRTSLMSLNVYGDDAGTFDDNGFLFDLNGVAAGAAHVFALNAKTGIGMAATARVQILGVTYYIPLCTNINCGGS